MYDEFKNDSEWISASDINKYSYCPYQWYYERKYGQREIARLAREAAEASGKEFVSGGRMELGISYHQRHFSRLRAVRRALSVFISLIIAAALLYAAFKSGLLFS